MGSILPQDSERIFALIIPQVIQKYFTKWEVVAPLLNLTNNWLYKKEILYTTPLSKTFTQSNQLIIQTLGDSRISCFHYISFFFPGCNMFACSLYWYNKMPNIGLRAVTVDYGIRLSRYGYSTCTVKPSGCQEYGCKFTVAKRIVKIIGFVSL